MSFFGASEHKELEQRRLRADYEAPELSPEERQAVERRKEAIDRLFKADQKLVATYKLEVNLEKGRSEHKPFAGSLMMWRSGSALSGGGDEVLYPCPDDGCPGVITPELVSSVARKAGCPKCYRLWPQPELAEMRLFKLPAQHWAVVLVRYFTRLNHDADLYLKTHPSDIRSSTYREKLKSCGGELLYAARSARVPVIYPLDRIYADLRAGADIEKRFRAFLSA